MKKLFALMLFFVSSAILHADTLTANRTFTALTSASFTLHSNGVSSFATITNFVDTPVTATQGGFSDPTPITLPSHNSTITINNVTLNYTITPTDFSTTHLNPVLSDCFLGEFSVDCSTVTPPTFNNASPLAASPNVKFLLTGVYGQYVTTTSLSGSIALNPDSSWEDFLVAPGSPLLVSTQVDLLPPSDPGSLLETPGDYETADTRYFVGQSFSESLSFTIDYTPPDTSPAPVPEPGSLLLLGSGLIFGARSVIARRGFRK